MILGLPIWAWVTIILGPSLVTLLALVARGEWHARSPQTERVVAMCDDIPYLPFAPTPRRTLTEALKNAGKR